MKKIVPAAITFILSGTTTDAGKTTIAKHALHPFLQAYYSDVSHIGFDDPKKPADGETIRIQKNDIGGLIDKLMMPENHEAFIVDVGGEEFQNLLPLLKSDIGDVVDIGRVVIVVGQNAKTDNAYAGIVKLIEQGIAADSIRVLFNRISQVDLDNCGGSWERFREIKFRDFLKAMRADERITEKQLCPVPLLEALIIGAQRGKANTIHKLAEKTVQELKIEAMGLRAAGRDEEYEVVRDSIILSKHASNVVESWVTAAQFVYGD